MPVQFRPLWSAVAALCLLAGMSNLSPHVLRAEHAAESSVALPGAGMSVGSIPIDAADGIGPGAIGTDAATEADPDPLAETAWRPDAATSNQTALERLDPRLRERAESAEPEESTIDLMIISSGALDLAGLAEKSASTPWPFGRTLTFARVKPQQILPIASLPSVESVESSGADSQAESRRTADPGDPGAASSEAGPGASASGEIDPEAASRLPTLEESRARLAVLKAKDVPWSEAVKVDQTLWMRGLAAEPAVKPAYRTAGPTGGAPLSGATQHMGSAQTGGSDKLTDSAQPDGSDKLTDSAQPDGWWDVGAGHNSRAAWLRGFKGEGVKVSVADDSVDFVHPDLQGTWAIVNVPAITTTYPTKPASRYNGWIQAFDPYSIAVYANENALGVAPGQEAGWLGNTRYVSTTQTAIVSRSWDDTRNPNPPAYSTVCFEPLVVTTNAARGIRPLGVECDYKVPRFITVTRGTQSVSLPLSRSGVLRYGNHPDQWLGNLYNERPGVLLVDPNTANTYDTVLVDLDNDHDFTDEKPADRNDPIIYRDMDGDGWPDISGGALHFIADGVTPLPGSYIFGKLAPPPPTRSVVMFTGAFERGDHGTLCSSNVVGQGRLPVDSTLSLAFSDLPGDGRLPFGPNQGAAPNAKLVPVSDVYVGGRVTFETAWQYLTRGPEPDRTEDDIQVSSNSYGFSEVHNDGWEAQARLVDRYIRTYNPNHSFIKATGNGAPGYGTSTSPAATTAVMVAASTEFGSTGWDSITKTSQILFGDIIPFSGRGPASNGGQAVSVAADGAYAAGADAINTTFNALRAWSTWGGTSRATPVTAGNMVLIYQAFKAKHARWPTWQEARAILMAGATHRGYDVLTQGAGVVDGGTSAMIAAGLDGIYSQPEQWRPGGYHGKSYPGFANVLLAGESDTAQFTLKGDGPKPVSVQLSAERLRKIGSYELPFRSISTTLESPYHFLTPDYLLPVDKSKIPAGTDLMVVRANWPMSQFDLVPNEAGRFTADNSWRLLVYQHTDVDGDGQLWEDRDGDGAVDKTALNGQASPYIDDYAPLDWAAGELDRWEFMRFGYNNSANNNLQVFVNHPLDRWADGMYIGLQHSARPAGVPRTDFSIRVEFYRYQDWPWLTLDRKTATVASGGDDAKFNATMHIPAGTAPGGYEGVILARYTGNGTDINAHTMVIPVAANVAARYDQTGAVTFGGPAGNDPDAQYNNGTVKGTFNWAWRDESGDWRYFFLDMLKPTGPGSLILTHNTWDDLARVSDIDTRIYGPSLDKYSDPNHTDNQTDNWSDPDFFGPYTMAPIKASTNRNLGSGRYAFDTVTGRSDEWVATSVKEGLQEIMLHNTMISATKFDVPFTLSVGAASVLPSEIRVAGKGCQNVVFSSGLDVPTLTVEAFGMSQPMLERGKEVVQDNVDDRTTASFKKTFSLVNAARISLRLKGEPGTDLNLILLRDANKDGQFTYPGERVAEAVTAAADESIDVNRPADGAYAVWVHGRSVPDGKATFNLDITAPSGTTLTVKNPPSGPVPAGTPTTFQLCYDLPAGASASLYGEAQIGLPGMPNLFTVAVRPNAPIYLPRLSRGQ